MKVLLSLALLLLCAGVTSPADAAAASHEFVLSGDRNSFVEVRLREPVRLTCCDFEREPIDSEAYFRISGLDVATRGSYSGFAIERVRDGRIMKGAVRVPQMDLEKGAIPTVISFGRTERLEAGRYRFHLLTDGPSTVRVEARGLVTDVHLRPSKATPVDAEIVDLTDQPGSFVRVPIEVPARSTVLLATKTEGDSAQAHYLSQCLSSDGGPCSDLASYEAWASPASGGGGGTRMEAFEGTVPPGGYDAVFGAGSAGIPEGSFGFVLVLR